MNINMFEFSRLFTFTHWKPYWLFICNTFFVLWKQGFSFSPLFLPAFSLNTSNNSPMTFRRVGRGDFFMQQL